MTPSLKAIKAMISGSLYIIALCLIGSVLGRPGDPIKAQTTPLDGSSEILSYADGDPCGILAEDGKLRSFGCGIVKRLTGNPESPEWETSWVTKCELKLQSCPLVIAPSASTSAPLPSGTANGIAGKPPVTAKTDPLSDFEKRLLSSTTIPVQLKGDFPNGAPQSDKALNINLASVLFNETAAEAIRKSKEALISDLQSGKVPTFLPGSIIAKAIWGTFPFDDPNTIDPSIRVFASTMKSDEQDSWKQMDENNNPQDKLQDPGAATALDPQRPIAWTFPIDGYTHFADPCQKAAVKGAKYYTGQLPWNCMHVIPANASTGFDQARAILDRNTLANLTINGSCQGKQKCIIALMAIHFMIRIDSASQLAAQGSSNWIFLTLWWTGQDNGLNLPSPWKYYQMQVTQSFRIDASDGQTKNVCFNPYLEGRRPGGETSNCVNCHYYAAYNKAKEQQTINLTNIGSTLGFLQPGQVPARNPKLPNACASAKDYGHGSDPVCTDFVWSLANLNDPEVVALWQDKK